MRRPDVAFFGLLGLVLAAANAAGAGPANRPDVVLITIDTLRPDALGWVAGNNETPVIDALAREGVAFASVVSEVPLTLPSHTSLFTGLIPRRHGVRDNGQLVAGGLVLLADVMAKNGYTTAAVVSGFPLRRQFGLDRGFGTYDDDLPEGREGWLERSAPETTKVALAWLAGLPGPSGPGQPRPPFFLWVHYYDPHDPYTPPREFWQPGPRGAYDGEVMAVDRALGDLRRGLAAVASANLLTVLTADHGESLGEHGEGSHGFFVYDASMLVPLIIHQPGSLLPRLSPASPRLIDITPTVLDLVGLPIPPGIDGVSVRPLLDGRKQELPAAYLETQQPFISYGWAPLRAVRHQGWKLIAAPRPELYDLTTDPGESRNQIDTARPRARRLETLLRAIEASPAATTAVVDEPAVLAGLAALGYIGSGRSAPLVQTGLADPKDRLVLRDRLAGAEGLLRAGDATAAVRELDAVLAIEPNNRFATLRAGMALLKAGQAKSAVPRLEKAVLLDPEQAEARFALADALTRVGDLPKAAQQWMETVRLQPRRFAAWSNLGTVLGRQGRLADAIVAFTRALELEPDNLQLRTNLGAAQFERCRELVAAGRSQEARELLIKAVSLAPELRAEAAADSQLRELLH